MGDLDKVEILRSDYLGLLGRKPGAGGPTIEEEFVQNVAGRYSNDQMVNLSVALHQITEDPDQESILREAITLLDHLETLGMEIRFKS